MNTILQDTPQKQCTSCKHSFPATPEFFYRNKPSPNGLLSRCKKCKNAAAYRHPPRSDFPPDYKRCSQCKQLLAATPEFFSKETRTKDGFCCYCRECNRKRRAKPPLYPVDEVPEGYKRCSRCKQNWLATFAFFCKDKSAQDGFTHWCRACLKQYRGEHKEYRSRHGLQYRIDHKIELQEYHKIYSKEYNQRPEVREKQRPQDRIKSHRRRALKKAVPGTLTVQQIQDKLKAQHYRCYYAACGFAKFEKVNGKYIYHLEHTIPISRTEAGPRNDVNFVVLACPTCNIKKHDKLPHEFFEGGRLF